MTTIPMNVLVPAIAALVGALFGSLAPIIVGVIQSRAEHHRERVRLATQLAIDDQKAELELVRIMGVKDVEIPPLSLSVVYHAELLELIARKSRITPDDLQKLHDHQRARSDLTRRLSGLPPRQGSSS